MKVIALSTSLLVERGGTAKAMPTGDARWNCGKALADDTGPEDRLGSAHDRAPATGPADP